MIQKSSFIHLLFSRIRCTNRINSNNLLVILLFPIIITSCTDKGGKEDYIKLPVVSLSTQPTQLHKYFVGDLNAFQNVEIRARVQGYLEEIYVDEGKPVIKGQPLFRLSNKEYNAAMSEANASLRTAIAQTMSAELELEKVKRLVEKGVVSPTEEKVAQANYEAIKAGIEKAQSILDNAKTQLSYTIIRSPFNGTTDIIPFKVGSLINEGTLLTSVSNIEHMNVYFNVSERDYMDFIKSKSQLDVQEVKLILSDGTYYPLNGIIEKKDGVFDENTGSISFRAKFLNPNGILKHGSTGTVELTNSVNNALLVPQKASFEIQDKNYVYVVNAENVVEMKSFVPQKRFSHYYIVASGLKPGDKIVYEGIQKLKNGMKITPHEVKLDTLASFSAFNKQ